MLASTQLNAEFRGREYDASAEKDEFHTIQMEKCAIEAEENLSHPEAGGEETRRNERTSLDWSITSRTNCRINIVSLHFTIELMKRLTAKDNDCKIKNLVCRSRQ